MIKLGIQYSLALLVVFTTSWQCQAQQNSILQRTHSILAPASKPRPTPKLALPSVNLQPNNAPTHTPIKRRAITPEMRSLLAPPATNHNSPNLPMQSGNHVPYAHAYSTEPLANQNRGPSPVVNAGGYLPNNGVHYGFNPYAAENTGTVQQVGGDDSRGLFVPPRISETRANNSFSQISTSEFAELRNAVPLDTVQDPELPRQTETDDPQQQDTQPRPLPDNLKPPTQLPIPPIDSNPSQQDPQIDPPKLDTPQEQGGVIYSDRALPGRQSYPGPTSSQQPPLIKDTPVPTNPRQTIYPPRDKKLDLPNLNTYPQNQGGYPLPPNVYPQEQRIHAQGQPVYPILPNSEVHGEVCPPPEPTGPFQPILEQAPPIPNQPSKLERFRKPNGWRPQLALGDPPDTPEFDPYTEPLFYLAAFGGISNADDLEGAFPAVGLTTGTFNLDDGANFGLVFGQYQGKNLRTEFEYAFRHNDIESIELTENTGGGLNLTSFDLAGDIKAHSGMTNVVWEFNNRPDRFIRPYVGTGVGFVFMDVNATRSGLDTLVAGQDGNSSFAYQWFAGINTQLSNEMDVFVEYRYFYADDLRLQTNLANVNGGAGILSSSFDYNTSNVNFGVRFKF